MTDEPDEVHEDTCAVLTAPAAKPYLSSFSKHYAKGKYVADRRFDAEAVSRQCDAATLSRARWLVSVA